MIVVTTPSGTVGSELVRLLAARDAVLPFRVVTRNPDRISQAYGTDVPAVMFDYDDHSTWNAALADIRMLFLVVPNPQPQSIRAHILPFIDAALEAGCQHIIYQSVPGADRQQILPHYQVERHIEASGIAYTFLRPSYFMQNLCGRSPTHGVDIATRHEIFIPAGRGKTSFIDTRDVASVVIKIFEDPEPHKNRGYLLIGPQSLDFFAVAKIFSHVLGYPVRYTNPSLPRFWMRMKKRGVPWSLIFFMTLEYTLARLGHAGFQSDELPALLGRPAIKMEQFVVDNKTRWETQTWV